MNCYRGPVWGLFLSSLLSLLLTACGGGGPGAPAPSTFFLVSSTPVNGAENVPADESVLLRFNRQLDPDTVTTATVRVRIFQTSALVPGTPEVENGDTIRWTADGLLEDGMRHRVTMSSGILSTGGEPLAGLLEIGFTTGTAPPDIVIPPATALRPTVGRMETGRRSHRATLLEDGRVLVTGGFRQGTSITDRAERFNPTNESFTELAGRMVEERASHTATRLQDGRVLLTGGWFERFVGVLASSNTAEIYDPATQTFTAVGNMTTERVDHAALLLPDGRVLVTGGSLLLIDQLIDHDSAEYFDPTTNTFTAHSTGMVHTHSTHGMVYAGPDTIIVASGSDTDLRPQAYDVASETFTALNMAAQDAPRFGAGVERFAGGGVSIAGGELQGTVLYVDGPTGFVQNTGSALTVPRSFGTATRYDTDCILVAGGADTSRGFFLLSTCDLVVDGGPGGSRTFATDVRFPVPMVLHTATRLSNGRILFCGGLNAVGGEPELDGAYLFTPP
ncbi:MAG: Ig-like domain-containing protein [Planctomycetota bacterium]|jgi:hypothetical protein